MFTRLTGKQLKANNLQLRRSYSNILDEIRAKSTNTSSGSGSKAKENRFAKQYAKANQPQPNSRGNQPRRDPFLPVKRFDPLRNFQKRGTPTNGGGGGGGRDGNGGGYYSNPMDNNANQKDFPKNQGFRGHDNRSYNNRNDGSRTYENQANKRTETENRSREQAVYNEAQQQIQRLQGEFNSGHAKDRYKRTNAPQFQQLGKDRKFKAKKMPKKEKLVKIHLPPFISVSNLATTLHVSLQDVFKKLEGLGFEDIRHSFILDKENATLIADEYGIEVISGEDSEGDLFPAPQKPELLKDRPPVVTIMGHVDHGKTTILDYLRKSKVVDKEFGGITQHIGAFSVITPQSKKRITFLDTPGHAAFLKMRERGAVITDIVVLVVAADDSVMPQTIEAIKHAKKAGVPIIVAVNKCDKPNKDVAKVCGDLAAQEIYVESYGGETQLVEVSGKTGLNMDKLEEAIVTLSELSEFKAEPKGVPAEGWIIESQVLKGLGDAATVLVTRGSLKPGDVIVAGKTFCKIRGMKDEFGKQIKLAGPSTPVQIWGWKDLPDSGDQILQASTEQIAKKVIDYRDARTKELEAIRNIEDINAKTAEAIKEAQRMEKLAALKKAGLQPDEVEDGDGDGDGEAENGNGVSTIKKRNYIIKADVFGSAEAIKDTIDGLANDEVKANVLSHSAGPPTDNDLEMAKLFDATLIIFNVNTPKAVLQKAAAAKVKVREHQIIYRVVEEVTEELSLMMKPRIETKILSETQILQLFRISKGKKKIKIAGSKVTLGVLKRGAEVRIIRLGEELIRGRVSHVQIGEDAVDEVRNNHECGLRLQDDKGEEWTKFEVGDVIQGFEEIEHKRYL